MKLWLYLRSSIFVGAALFVLCLRCSSDTSDSHGGNDASDVDGATDIAAPDVGIDLDRLPPPESVGELSCGSALTCTQPGEFCFALRAPNDYPGGAKSLGAALFPVGHEPSMGSITLPLYNFGNLTEGLCLEANGEMYVRFTGATYAGLDLPADYALAIAHYIQGTLQPVAGVDYVAAVDVRIDGSPVTLNPLGLARAR